MEDGAGMDERKDHGELNCPVPSTTTPAIDRAAPLIWMSHLEDGESSVLDKGLRAERANMMCLGRGLGRWTTEARQRALVGSGRSPTRSISLFRDPISGM